jgi:hypothetical protein
MNENTRDNLIRFITEVENLAHAVSSVAGTDALKQLYEAAEAAKSSLQSDETVP